MKSKISPASSGAAVTMRGRLQKVNLLVRMIILIAAMVVFVFLCVLRLMKIQIVDGIAYYAPLLEKTYTVEQSVQAARGQIFDSQGRVLNTNKIVYKVIVQRAFFPPGGENDIISATIDILEQNGETWIDTVPLSFTEPFRFSPDATDAELDQFKRKLVLNVDASARNCYDQMLEKFGIDVSSDGYSAKKARQIAGVRYEMLIRDFSFNNRYTFTEDISLGTVIRLKEHSGTLAGIDIVEEPMRIYENGGVAPHSRGTIGAISAEEYEERKDQGYTLSDIIGKNGIELAMESVLRGQNGVRTIVRDSNGAAVSDEITAGVTPGNSAKLTVDGHFQSQMQEILKNHIDWLHTTDQTVATPSYQRGLATEGGSVVVLEVKTGRVLAMVNYPTYDINDYINNYYDVLNADMNPLFNRATMGLYRPGSTFKTITGAAGLLYGAITPHSTVTCTGTFHAFTDFFPKCTGQHGTIAIEDALKVSCNIFFYQVGLDTGIDNIDNVAAHFGIGTDLGLETGGTLGRVTSPENYEQLTGKEFTAGDIVQAAIGQSEPYITPLNLAVQAMTLANAGVRYQPYLVDSVWNYDGSELVYQKSPVIADSFAADRPELYATIKSGMIKVTDFWVWPPDRIDKSTFAYLPDRAACKTGSPEVGDGTYNSTITGFYPANDPVIAFGVVLENSDFSRYIVRNIIDAYFYDRVAVERADDGLITAPWKPWTEAEQKSLPLKAKHYNN